MVVNSNMSGKKLNNAKHQGRFDQYNDEDEHKEFDVQNVEGSCSTNSMESSTDLLSLQH